MKIQTLFLLFCLTLLLSCKKEDEPYYNGSGDLAGTKWHLYQYRESSSGTPSSANDTLIFTDATHYTYNHTTYNYYLSPGDYTHLTLHDTPFGNIDGTVPGNFIANGQILSVPFAQIAGGSLTYYLWLQKF